MVGLVGAGALALSACAKEPPAPGTSTWEGSSGSFKDVTRASGSRDAGDGAWKLTIRDPGKNAMTVDGAATSDGFRAAVAVGDRAAHRVITASRTEDGGLTGQVTKTQHQFDDSGSRIETPLAKALFDVKVDGADRWSGVVQLADVIDDEEVMISGRTSGDAWQVAIDRPNNPYVPHTEFKGTGPISLDELVTLAVTEAT